MRALLPLLLFVGTAAGKDDVKDMEQLQGVWQAVALESGGEKAPEDVVKMFKIQIKGDKLVFNPDSEKRTHAIVLNSKLKEMDLTPEDGPMKGKKMPCAIYKIDGDKLIICIDKDGKEVKRPGEFKTKEGDGCALLTFERVKK